MFIDEIIKQTVTNMNKSWICNYAGDKMQSGQIVLHILDGKITIAEKNKIKIK